ncbi:DUF4232 domain-containing protein [Kitasatospora paranensis]|uniref:DUF4232 domain-containing protein n=1 Tax=Kitasatospora paranensis TaxID=258053 RepID=UPI0031E73C2F
MKQRPATAVRAAAAVTAALTLTLGAVGCSSSGTAAAGAPAASPTVAGAAAPGAGTASASAAGRSDSAATAGASATATGPDRCHASELKADVQLQGTPGSAMVMLTNKGDRTCTVKGYLGYGGLLADNSRVDVATARVPRPGAPVTVTLKPGTTAFSGLKWTLCDKADATCQVLAGIVVTPPDETTQVTATVYGTDAKTVLQLPVAKAGLTVGTLQPSSQGVVLG